MIMTHVHTRALLYLVHIHVAFVIHVDQQGMSHLCVCSCCKGSQHSIKHRFDHNPYSVCISLIGMAWQGSRCNWSSGQGSGSGWSSDQDGRWENNTWCSSPPAWAPTKVEWEKLKNDTRKLAEGQEKLATEQESMRVTYNSNALEKLTQKVYQLKYKVKHEILADLQMSRESVSYCYLAFA
jgi:hypothetical protein